VSNCPGASIMADFIQGLFGLKATTTSVLNDGFADYATSVGSSPASQTPSLFGAVPMTGRPYTKWYAVWERVTIADFYAEMVILPIAFLIIAQLVWGRGTNRAKARNWITAAAPILQKEFASVGFTKGGASQSFNEAAGPLDPNLVLKEKTATEFTSYATGRQNVAFLDIKINVLRRFNPLVLLVEYVAAVLFQISKAPKENLELVMYTFDGREKELVSAPAAGEEKLKISPSTHDGFVWAIVHKDNMKAFRHDRFDVSLTDVKDNSKLPNWATVMSESAEITDALLTPELVKAVETAGEDLFENLLITDMPSDKPRTLEDLEPRKRLSMSVKLPSGSSVSSFDRTLPLLSHFIRLPDDLVSKGKFRAEVQRRLKNTREDELKRVKKIIDEEKADERKVEADKKKKQDREELLRNMTPAEQRKYLDKEREKSQRKSMRRMRA